MARRYGKRRRGIKGGNILIILLLVALIVAGIVCYMGFTSSKSTYRNKGIECVTEGKYSEGVKWFEQALKEEQWLSDDIDNDIRYYLAEAYIHTGEYEKALEEYNVLIEVSEDYANTLFYQELTIALVSYSDGNYDAVIKTMEDAISRGYDNLYGFIGSCYGLKGNYEKMFSYFKMYEDAYGETSYIDSQYATAYLNLGEYGKVMDYVNKGLALDDSTYKRQLLLVEIGYYEYMADYQTAFDKVKAFIKEYPDDEDGQDEYNFLYTRVSK